MGRGPSVEKHCLRGRYSHFVLFRFNLYGSFAFYDMVRTQSLTKIGVINFSIFEGKKIQIQRDLFNSVYVSILR